MRPPRIEEFVDDAESPRRGYGPRRQNPSKAVIRSGWRRYYSGFPNLPIFTPFWASQLRRVAETGTTLEALLLVWQAFLRETYLP
jgi:hypothetical protein